jgi:hypothetical protein
MYKYFKAKEKLRKIFNYFSIFTIIFGTTFGSINPAIADDTITADDTYDAAINTALDADEDLIINGTVTLTFDSVGITGSTTGAIIMGDADANTNTEAVIIDINSTTALTIDRAINEVTGGGAVATIKIDDDADGAAVDAVTFSGIIGAVVAPNALTVGTEGATGGHAIFQAATTFGAITVSGGDALEVSIVDFQAAQAGAITLNHSSASDATAKVIVSGSTTATIAGAIDGGGTHEGTVQITGTGKTLTGAIGGTNGISTLDIDATTSTLNTVDAAIVDIATGAILTTDDDFTGDATTLNGTAKIIFATDAGGAAATAVTAVIDGASDGDGTIQFTNTSLTTVTGNIGVTKQIGTIDVDQSATIVGILDAAVVDIAAGATLKVDDDYTGTVTTLTTTAVLEFIVDATGAAATTVTGTIDGAAVEGGDIKVNNAGGTTFASAIGSLKSIGDINIDEAATFNSTVSGETMDVAASKVGEGITRRIK